MNPSLLSTADLRALERQYQQPASMVEALALRGVRAELAIRRASVNVIRFRGSSAVASEMEQDLRAAEAKLEAAKP